MLLGVYSVKNFQDFKEDTEEQLNRDLAEKEMKFLKWIFKRYENEQHKKKQEKDPIT